MPFRDLRDYVDRAFRHVADNKKLDFEVDVKPGVPRSVNTDAKRLQQILKNLLSNAFKFTDQGSVRLTVKLAEKDERFDHEVLRKA